MQVGILQHILKSLTRWICTWWKYKQNTNTSMSYAKLLTSYFLKRDSQHKSSSCILYMCSILWNPEFAPEIPEITEHTFYHPALSRAGLQSTHAISPTNTILRNIHVHVKSAPTAFAHWHSLVWTVSPGIPYLPAIFSRSDLGRREWMCHGYIIGTRFDMRVYTT